jgi:hypothetical protein
MGVVPYMMQYVKTATNGNVVVIFAYATDRMQLACNVCDQTLTCARPDSAEKIDWAMQEFVELHRHVMDSPEGKIPSSAAGWYAPAPATAGFKPVKMKPKSDDWGITEGRKFR